MTLMPRTALDAALAVSHGGQGIRSGGGRLATTAGFAGVGVGAFLASRHDACHGATVDGGHRRHALGSVMRAVPADLGVHWGRALLSPPRHLHHVTRRLLTAGVSAI